MGVRLRRMVVVISIIFILCMHIFPVMTWIDGDLEHRKSFKISQSPIINKFSENMLLSTVDDIYPEHVEPTLAISESGVLFVGWKNAYTPDGGGVRVSFSRSEDGGDSWSTPVDMPMINGLHTRQSDPWLFWHNGVLYYAYLEFEPDGLSQITVAHSYDNGTSWSPVTASYGDYFADKETMVVTDNGTVYVAYDDVYTSPEGGNSTVKLTCSTNGGSTFRKLSVIGEADSGNLGPYITAHGADLYVAFTYFMEVGGNIVFKRSIDGGLSWSQASFVNDDGNYSQFTVINGRPSKLTLPVIRFDSNNRLYILWADKYDQSGNTFDVYLRYSDDFGATWSDRFQINPVTSGDQWEPDMDIDSWGRLHIVYYDERDDAYRIYYRLVEFAGEDRDELVMSDPLQIATASTSSEFTRPGDYCTIRVDSTAVPHVVWSDSRDGEMDIYYAHGVNIKTTITFVEPPISKMVVLEILVIAAVSVIIVIYLIKRRRFVT